MEANITNPFATSKKLHELEADTPYIIDIYAQTSTGKGVMNYIEDRTQKLAGNHTKCFFFLLTFFINLHLKHILCSQFHLDFFKFTLQNLIIIRTVNVHWFQDYKDEVK